jgi:hypothetical protein
MQGRSILGRLQPAADWESACRHAQRIFNGLPGALDRAAGIQPAPDLCKDSRVLRKSRLKGGYRQDCLPHNCPVKWVMHVSFEFQCNV